MANKRSRLGMLVIVLVFGMTVAGCDNGNNGSVVPVPRTVVFESTDAAGTQFRLTFTENLSRAAAFSPSTGDSFELRITPVSGSVQISRGAVQSSSGGNISLLPTGATAPFSVTVSGGNMTGITGEIAVEGGGTVSAPEGALTPGTPPTLPPDTGNDPFSGTWEAPFDDPYTEAHRIVAANGLFTQYAIVFGTPRGIIRGTYTVSGNAVTLTYVEVDTNAFGGGDDAAWVEWADLDSYFQEIVGGSQTLSFTITGNEFTIFGIMTFTRQ